MLPRSSGNRVNKPLIVIVGPTGSGKSELAMRVARRYGGEIICADSRTVYKGMDIGTAKPTVKEQQEVRHHVLDVVKPTQRFTAANFKQQALRAIQDIRQRAKLPILVGGTGLYVDAVLFDYQFGPDIDVTQRAVLAVKSVVELQQICRQNNIVLPPNYMNKRHLLRAIELRGLLNDKKVLRKNTLVVGITIDREKLRNRITNRATMMIEQGVIEEIGQLSQQYGWDNEAMTANIFRIFRGVVKGTKEPKQALEEVIKSDMNLAKRQMTWFKRNPAIHWSNEPQELFNKIEQFIES